METTVQGFHNLHEQLYTFQKPEDRSRNSEHPSRPRRTKIKTEFANSHPGQSGCGRAALKGSRPVYSASAQDYVETDIYNGDQIVPGNHVAGPAIIEEARTSIVLFAGQGATLDEHLTYVIEVE